MFSSTGCGGYHTAEIGLNIAHEQWSQYEIGISSNFYLEKAQGRVSNFEFLCLQVSWAQD